MAQFGFGDHIVLMYAKPDEQWQKVIPFIKEGLLAKEKIVYVADDNPTEAVKNAMLARDKELFESALARGDISILTSQDTYHRDGEFDPEDMYLLIAKLEQEALAAGYKGIRGFGEMTWVFRDVPGAEKLVEYEENLSAFLHGRKICVVCQYDQAKFDQEMINLMQRVHPKQI